MNVVHKKFQNRFPPISWISGSSGFVSGSELQPASKVSVTFEHSNTLLSRLLTNQAIVDMREASHAKIVIGSPSLVKFNIGVVGAAGAGKKTFTDALTKPYDLNSSDCQVNVISEEQLTSVSLKNKHRDWLLANKNPTMDEVNYSPAGQLSSFLVFTQFFLFPATQFKRQQSSLHFLCFHSASSASRRQEENSATTRSSSHRAGGLQS